jgi:hypothetical protein
LGIADREYAELGTLDAIKQMFDRFYPSFESRSGWSIKGSVRASWLCRAHHDTNRWAPGDYEELPDATRRQMERFYDPFNRMLQPLLGESFDW